MIPSPRPCRVFVPALLYVAFLTHAASAWAGVGAADSPGVSGAAFFQMLSGLVLVIGLLLGTAFLMRKLNGGRAFGQAGPMRIVAQLMISARERVVLLEVGEQWIVVGVVPGQIKTLHTLPKGQLAAADSNAEPPFARWLKHFSERPHAEN